MAKEINKFVILKINNLREKLPTPTLDPISILKKLGPQTKARFNIKYATNESVVTLLKQFKGSNSCGDDPITMNIVKAGINQLSPHLTNLINSSIATNTMPDILKTSRITPILKPEKNQHQMGSYRPINNLPTLAKIVEKHIFAQLQDYLIIEGLIHENHHGGLKGHSTTTAMLHLQDTLYNNTENNYMTGILMTDLSSAFDTVDHKILLQKMNYMV
jgi:hypothetical protein